MQPLRITAILVNGYVSSDALAPALDGIMAAVIMRDRLGEDYALSASRPSAMEPVEGLPLERIEHDGLWWYSCSIPIADIRGREHRYVHRRFDDTEAAERVPLAKRIQDKAGAYKTTRLALTRHLARAIVWHAVGIAEEIEALVRRVDAIGARRASGYGEVSNWLVEAGGDETRARTHRPLPIAYASEHGIQGAAIMAGIRPPARLPCNNVECVVSGAF